jgi:intracellular sulfur oxidation DsrE/DsrF family protein
MKKYQDSHLLRMFLVGFFLLTFAGQTIASEEASALQGMTAAKVVFDVKKNEPQELLRALAAIRNARESISQQGVQPDFIVTFRGGAVVCLANMKEDPDLDEYKEDILDKISWNIIELKKAGVQMEICSLALNLAGMKDTELLSGIKKVGNSLVSLIAYQNRGYAMVAI